MSHGYWILLIDLFFLLLIPLIQYQESEFKLNDNQKFNIN